jgi:nicotinamide-nucleotide amidase
MVIELINTGGELMLGRVLNTHQQWLCRQLADHGLVVTRQVAIPDEVTAITEAVREALGRADVILTTGGLGPTSDDLTRDGIARLLGCPLREDPAVVTHIQQYFTQRHRPQPASTLVQAQVPAGATVLMNAFGTAPGLVLEVPGGQFRPGTKPTWLVMLPGPPRELQPMFQNQVLPWLQTRLPSRPAYACLNLRTTGIGESQAEEKIRGPLQDLVDAGLVLGYCARVGEVDVRLEATGPGAAARVAQAAERVRAQLGEVIFATGEAALETVVVQELVARRQRLVLAESCTGGFLAHRITNVPGASAVFWAGLVTYDNAAKEQLLDVSAATLAEHGAVSEPVAREMAAGARERYGADYALSVTGIAGPGGGSEAKPIGTVFVGLAGPRGVSVTRHLNRFDRETFKWVTSQQALDRLRRELGSAAV